MLTEFAYFDENYYSSELFHLISKYLDQYHPLLGFFTKNGKLEGAINLFRPRSHKPFDTHDQTLFVRLLPYVNHAMQNQNAHEQQYVNQDVTGMLLMDVQGSILYQNATAERLWLLAQHPLMTMGGTINTNLMLPQLRQLCRNLNTLFAGKDAPPPSFSHSNGRGPFYLHGLLAG